MAPKWRGLTGLILLGATVICVLMPLLLCVADIYIELYGDSSPKAVRKRLQTTLRLALVAGYFLPDYPQIRIWIAKDSIGRFAIAFHWLQRACDMLLRWAPHLQSSQNVVALRLVLQAHGIH